MTPAEIEARSFEIIDKEAGPHDFSPEQWAIVRRMIHTSADFDYLKTVRFHPDAVAAGIDAIRNGKTITTDTNMAKAGIRTGDLQRFGVRVQCYMADPAVSQKAAAQGMTRAKAAVDAALSDMQGGIYAVGNAPTALLRLIDLVKARQALPALIVGLPVGFVNAAESKSDLIETGYPYISNVGRKGGSNVAASVVNALVKLAMAGTE
jgi:precorrin-8X/cobalt-precorrin-8 methylmutase